MSFAFIVMTVLLGSSIAFVLHPSEEHLAASAHSHVSHHRHQGMSWESIRKGLLGALNMQTEPRLPAGGLDGIREKWGRTTGTITHKSTPTATPAVSPDSGNSTSLKCCSMASEVSMKDLGWDSWVIHPRSLTIVQCALCNSAENTVHWPLPDSGVQDANSQDPVPCCQPTHDLVPIVYMDESSTVVISSVQLTRGCGCGPGDVQQPSE